MNVLDALAEKEDVIMGKGVSPLEISSAERALNLVFSDDYKEYLLDIGVAIYDGHELTGLGCADYVNVVLVTQQMRSIYKDIPSNWYVIENWNIDDVIIWQDEKGCIYYRNEKIHNSLVDYILDL